MNGIEWLIASLPLIGLFALLSEITIRAPEALLGIALDCETFAREKPASPKPVEMLAPSALALRA